MDIDRARAVAERLHAADREEDGTPLLEHIRRAASAVPLEARPVAWLHEALEWTVVPEQELLTNGLSDDQLRALRLLHRTYALGLILLRGPAHALDHAVGTTAS